MKTKLLCLLLLAFSFGNAQVTAGLLQEFRFDNSYTNQNSDVTFTNNASTSFVTDRFGNANSALTIQNNGITAAFPAIPQGNQARTVSVWVISQSTVDNQVFNYGTASTNQAYGFSVNSSFVTNYGWGNDLTLNGYTIGPNSWVHIVTTYDGTTAKIYYNGVLQASGAKAWNTNGFQFRLGRSINGSNGFYGHVDDLKVYNRAITDAEVTQLYNQTNASLAPIIADASSTVTTDSATINYSLNANSANTTSVINWGVSNGNLTNQVTGFSATGNTVTPGSATINGLLPGVVYHYEIRATNINGTTTTTVYNFTTNTPSLLISEYKFDNSLFNETNNSNFSAPGVVNPLYTTDRFGQTNSALVTSNASLYRDDIIDLPVQDKPRTISLWIRPSLVNNDNILFTYGSPSGNNVYGGSFNATNTYNFSYVNNLAFVNPTTVNNWKHIVITFDASKVAKIYVDGVLGNQNTFPVWFTSGSNNFFLGNSFGATTGAFNGAIDDLKIYNYALTASEVSNLFTGNDINPLTPPQITNVSILETASTGTITYSLTSNQLQTTSIVKYGLSATTMSSQVSGFSSNNASSQQGSAAINGLQPSTTYFYQIEATNQDGTTLGTIESFTTLAGQTIAEYSFDNTYNNLLGNSPFTSNSGSSFVNDRNGNSNAAINLTNDGIEASIPALPFNGSSRTISLWAKLNTMQSYNHTFSYGGIFTGLGFAGSFNQTAVDFFGYSNDFNVLSTNAVSTWYHFVYTYDGVNVKIYKNGVLFGAAPKNLNTAVYDIFSLGRSLDYSSTFNGAIDDLKIYNYAVSDIEVSNLYNNNSLANENFTLESKIKLYPNPVRDILNIETDLEIQSVEIYTIQGQKVVSSTEKQINVSQLTSGIYLVKIQDAENKTSTKKIVIK